MSRRHYSRGRGEGHREADPTALADLLSDGGAATRHGNRDPAGRRGLLGHDRGRVRPPLLRRPRRARRARHPAARRQAGRGLLRAGELLARARGLPPPRDRVHRRGARVAADRAEAARRRVRLRRAAAARAPADHLGAPEPARTRPSSARSGSASPRRPAAPRSPPAWPRSTPRSTAASGSSSSTSRCSPGEVAQRRVDPYQLLYQGGQFYLVGYSHERDDVRVFRLSRIRGKVAYATKAEHDFQRPPDFDPRVYANRIPLAARRHAGHRGDLGLRPHRLARRAQLRPLRRDGRRRGRRRPRLPHAVLDPAARASRGRSATASTPASSARRSSRPRRASGSTRSSSATGASRSRASPRAARPAPTSPRTPSRPAARARRRRSGPSASPASSRSPPC